MAERIPQSVAKLVVFRAYLASDGTTPATGKTIAITLSKNGATSFSNPNAGATNAVEMASGFYKFTLDTTDTNTVGPLVWRGAEAAIHDAADVYTVAVPDAVNVTQIDGQATTGNNATLNLKQLNVVNSTGDAMIVSSTGSNGRGLAASGHGTGAGMAVTGGNAVTSSPAGHGLLLTGGTASSTGGGLSGTGLRVIGGTATSSNYAGPGVVLAGGSTGNLGSYGLHVMGSGAGDEGGPAVRLVGAGNADGLQVVAAGTGDGIAVTAGATGDAVHLTAASGDGIDADTNVSGVSFRGGITGDLTGTVSGLVTANVTQISGDSGAADALESYLDGSEFMPVDAHKPNFAVAATTLTVKKPDGSTTAYTKTVTTDPAAEPITGAS